MSNIFLPKAHIDALITAALHFGEEFPGGEFYWYTADPRELAQAADPRELAQAADLRELAQAADPTELAQDYWGEGIRRNLRRDNAKEVGAMLWRTNFVIAEWDQDPASMPEYTFDELPGTPDPILVLKAISSYIYQTQPETLIPWLLSDAYSFLKWLQSAAIARLDGFSDAPWVLDDPLVFQNWTSNS